MSSILRSFDLQCWVLRIFFVACVLCTPPALANESTKRETCQVNDALWYDIQTKATFAVASSAVAMVGMLIEGFNFMFGEKAFDDNSCYRGVSRFLHLVTSVAIIGALIGNSITRNALEKIDNCKSGENIP